MNANDGRPRRRFKWDLNQLPPDDENEAMSSQLVSEGTSPPIIFIDSDDDNEPVDGQRGNYVPVVAPVGGAPTIGVNLVGTSSSNHRNQRRRVGYSNICAIYSGYNLPSPTPPSPQSPSVLPFSPPPPLPPLSPSPLPSPSPPPPPSTPAPAPAPAPALAPSPEPALAPSPSSPPTPSPPPPSPPQEPPTITCAICLDAVAKSVTTRCGHIFCADCITKSIARRGPRCPTCRDKVNKKDLRQVQIEGPSPLPPLSRPVCPICMRQLTEEMATQCGHVYCEACISAALAFKNKCPICKKKATYRKLIRIHLDV